MYNGLGSVTNIVDYSGAEKALYFYDAFGNPRYAVEFTSNVWRYTGEQRDADSGMYYLRARYYDSAIGRFLGRDRVPREHPYAYVENNPVNFVDPYGLWKIKIGGTTVFDTKPVEEVASTVVNEVEEHGLDVLTQCAAWGVGGAIAGGLPGAAAGCAAGAGAEVAEAIFGPNPLSECVAWGANGFFTIGGWGGAGIGCATGVAGYYAPRDSFTQCLVWLTEGFIGAKMKWLSEFRIVRAGAGNCWGAALAAHNPSVAYAAGDSGGKE